MRKSGECKRRGFTLIELSIVLVIIGLLVGGVLVGNDLIKATNVRATITQIEKYNQAVNTFKVKFGELPGDMDNNTAVSNGFAARETLPGKGDGNGIIEGFWNPGCSYCQSSGSAVAGETTEFWVDLSTAHLIDNGFTKAVWNGNAGGDYMSNGARATLTTTPSIADFFPAAKLGQGNFINVWSGGYSSDGANYFSIIAVNRIYNWGYGSTYSPVSNINQGPTVKQAFDIDSKIDDGLPQSGRVMAISPLYVLAQWAGGSYGPPSTTATPGSATTCYDNNNIAGPMAYSISQNNGAGINCPISFKFQ